MPRNFASNGARPRGFTRPVMDQLSYSIFNSIVCQNLFLIQSYLFKFNFQADRADVEDQPPAKRRLSSAVVKVRALAFCLI